MVHISHIDRTLSPKVGSTFDDLVQSGAAASMSKNGAFICRASYGSPALALKSQHNTKKSRSSKGTEPSYYHHFRHWRNPHKRRDFEYTQSERWLGPLIHINGISPVWLYVTKALSPWHVEPSGGYGACGFSSSFCDSTCNVQ